MPPRVKRHKVGSVFDAFTSKQIHGVTEYDAMDVESKFVSTQVLVPRQSTQTIRSSLFCTDARPFRIRVKRVGISNLSGVNAQDTLFRSLVFVGLPTCGDLNSAAYGFILTGGVLTNTTCNDNVLTLFAPTLSQSVGALGIVGPVDCSVKNCLEVVHEGAISFNTGASFQQISAPDIGTLNPTSSVSVGAGKGIPITVTLKAPIGDAIAAAQTGNIGVELSCELTPLTKRLVRG